MAYLKMDALRIVVFLKMVLYIYIYIHYMLVYIYISHCIYYMLHVSFIMLVEDLFHMIVSS